MEKRIKGEEGEVLERSAPSSAPPSPEPARETVAEGTSPLSYSQKALWFLDRLEPGNAAYVVAGAAVIPGRLDPRALQRAFRRLFRRHPALRFTFGHRGGEPFQRVAPPEAVPAGGWFRTGDLSGLAPREREARLVEEAFRPFDVEAGPLLRVGLFRTGESEQRLVLSMHHLVADLWSLGVLVGELSVLLAGLELPPARGAHFFEHVRRERERLAGLAGEADWDFWRETLAGAPTALDLPADRPRPPVQTFRGGVRTTRLRPGLGDRTMALANEAGATPFMALLAAWAALLSRWSGQTELLIGTPTAGRRGARVARVVGYFVNPVVLRVDLSGTPGFRELLARVRDTATAALAHQRYPFALLTEKLVPERDPSRSPVFQVLFGFQRAPRREAEAMSALALGVPGVPLRLGGIDAETAALDRPAAQLDLSLFFATVGGELAASLEYNADLWDGATASRILEHVETLLAAAVDEPDRPVSELALLPPAERHQLLHEWNDTAAVGGRPACLHELVDAQAARTPDAVALVHGAEAVSYRELHRRAERLARRLRALGAGPEVPVAVAMARTPALVTSILAVLRAGGAYVPIDLAHPPERIGLILRDSGARLLLVGGAERPPDGAVEDTTVVDVEAGDDAGEAEELPPAVSPENLAYAIYTSGSTGRPKGVAIRHAAATALVRWAAEVFPDEDLSGVLASTSICFDLSVFELFLPLARGGRVVLARDALELPALDAAPRVTLVNTVPSVLGELIRVDGLPPSLRTINLAGEPLSRDLVDDAFRSAAGVGRVLNLYGPSEDTTYSTWTEVPRSGSGEPQIGRPVLATRAHVTDGELRLVAAGRPGELCLGGAGLARGYLGRPGRTAESFVPDPFGGEPGGRLYRTGDLVRHCTDGGLRFLGRRDHQVKVRGFRIEPGEVEAALGSHPGVAECSVVARGEGADRRLVAYWAPSDEGAAPGRERHREMTAFLAARLPDYMVPSAWVPLPALPRTPNGKVDRKALPEPAAAPEEPGEAELRSPTEEIVAGIWAEVLGIGSPGSLGPHESFFDLGGHSLLATRVAARVREALGVELPVRALFSSPTVRALAVAVERARESAAGPALPPLAPVAEADRTGPLPTSAAQERMWFLERFEPGAVYNLPAEVRFRGPLDAGALARALAEIVRRHETLRTTFEEGADGVFQRVGPAPGPRLPVVDLSGLPGSTAAVARHRLAAREARCPFDLAEGPVLRTTLLREAPEDHTLLLSMHHVVSDGWSLGVFARELGTLYGAYRDGEPGQPSPLPELPLQYADYAVWQRSWLDRPDGDEPPTGLAWWTRTLDGLATLDLPIDRPRPPKASFTGGVRRRRLSRERVTRATALARRQGATLFMVLTGAFAALLSRLAGEDDVPLGTPVANRDRVEIEGLIGPFVNTLVLRIDASADPTFRELLGRVRGRSLDAYAHQEVPFERLVEALQPERDPSRTPLFQVMLTLQNARGETVELPGVDARAERVEAGIAKFDLNLSATETPDGGLALEAEYARDLFDATTVDRLLGHLERLLAGATADPETRLSRLSLLSPEQRAQVVVEWNATTPVAAERPVQRLIADRAESTPEAVAVAFGDLQLSYGELVRRAWALAALLLELGAGPEVRVGLCVERSLDLPVGALGILAAGAVYVPLDPDYPDARLAVLLEDSGAAVLLVQTSLRERLRRLAPGAARLVEIGSGAVTGSPSAGSGSDLPPDAGTFEPEGAAYVIFTSGSTGRPKGAVNTHRATTVRMLDMQRSYGLTAADRVLHKTPFSFDVSVWELLWPLVAGARLEVARPGGHRDGRYLARTIARRRISHLHFVPSMLHVLLDEPEVDGCDSLRRVFAGGEALSPALARRFEERLGGPCGVELLNMYGPAEAAIDATSHRVLPGEERIPIGRPVDGTRVHLLDRRGFPVPVGVTGELSIGGVQVARGYLGRPGPTAERFVPDPFGAPGARLYRTGDLARYLADGEVDFQGRIDHQVKVRGVRVELGETESVLLRHPAVSGCAVVAREGAGGLRLVAYWVAAEGARVTEDELREHLGRHLPDPMIPGAWVGLDRLPLSPNGKVDRKALPEPPTGAGEGRGAAAPRTPTEEIVAGLWADVLEVSAVDSERSFFDLGGHSLLAARVMARLRRALGVDLPLRTLFDAPTVRGLAAAADRRRTTGDGAEGPAPPPLASVPRGERAPASAAQERMWFLERFHPGAVYTLPAAVSLRGPLDVGALARALAEIVRRHEALRTIFEEGEGGILQRIAPPPPARLPVVDLSGLAATRLPAVRERLASREARRPFDLAVGPLLRTTLLRAAPDDHSLLFSMHHVASDGWSLGVFARELGALYGAYRDDEPGQPSPLPELPLQYADYALWQRSWLDRRDGDEPPVGLAWWTGALEGLATLDLPTDRPRPPAQSFRGGVRRRYLSPELATGAEALARREGATLFMVLCAGLSALLARLTGQEDVPVGTPVANRDRVEVEGLIGLFINTLVLRTDASGAPSFTDLLSRVRETALEAYAHQEVPFEWLVEALQPERDPSRSPLFQVMLALQNARAVSIELPELDAEVAPVDAGIAKLDLNLSVTERPGGGLAIDAEYARDLFDPTTVDRLLGHLERLLSAAVADPLLPLPLLPVLSPAQRAQVVMEWNATRPLAATRTIHERIAEQAERTPEAVAVSFETRHLSYRELLRRAEALAARLRRHGVGPEVRVGLCAERSLDLVTGLLGILVAGGAYVPLDPGYPDARLAMLLEDSGTEVLLVQATLRERLRGLAGTSARLLALEEEPGVEESTGESAEPAGPTAEAGPGHAAYVIFTSGSTGRPKGAVNAHRGVVNRLLWMQRAYGLTPDDGVLQKTPFSFDVSVWEFFWPLLTGARLVVARPEGHKDGGYLVRTIARERVTHIHFVPSMLRAFLEEPEVGRCGVLRRVIASGEALPTELVRRFHDRLGGVELHNLYGPTEAAVDVTHHPCRPGEDRTPIGRPVDGVRIHLLDRAVSPVPIGVAGELHIGGVQVARGYLDRPALTAERFVPDPFGAPGARLYRTGDLARHLADGEVEYLGRIDHQVKLRGFRIELGEIESTLGEHPAVHECVVMVREGAGGPRLVAYWVAEREGTVAEDELAEHLRSLLPEHMVPSAWVALDGLPLSPNGKVDRKALPEPAAPPAPDAGETQVLRSPVEEIVAGIWAEVLGLDAVSSDRSFFELGGHSLLATRVVARLRRALGVELPVRALFEAPTVRALSAAVRRARAAGTAEEPPPLVAEEHGDRLVTSPAQERMWFLESFEPGSVYNLPVAVRLAGAPDTPALARALAEIARRHASLRTTFGEDDEGVFQRVAPPPPPRLPVIDLSGLPPRRRVATHGRLAVAAARRPFDLAEGPLLRTALLRAGADDHTLLVSMHHVVSDGWSLDVLARELGVLYGAFRAGEPSPLPELPIQYADYAAWQRRWLDGPEPPAGLRYWTGALTDLAVLDLPVDRPRQPMPSYRGGVRRRRLVPELAERAVALARREGATLFMVLTAAFAALLARLTGQDDLPVGTPVANRDRVEIEGLIGLFVNTLVLRADGSGDPPFSALLARVRETSLAAYAHQEVPFERLVEALRPERDPSRSPLFQVMLSLQVVHGEAIELPGLEARALEVEAGVAKFDFSLHVAEAPDGSLALEAEFARDLFDASTVDRWLGHLERLFAAALEAPEIPLSKLPLLSRGQRAQLVREWNTTRSLAVERSLHELVAARAAERPDGVALSFEGWHLSYGELTRRARALAARLRALGVDREVRVGLCAESGPELPVGVLAILEAGGVYVPLDPEHPDAWLAILVEDAAPPLVLARASEMERLARLTGEGVRLVELETAESALDPGGGETAPAERRPPGDVDGGAYVIFTAGSTGRPKGVVVSHRAIGSRVLEVQRAHPLGTDDGVLQKAPFSSDTSLWELFWPLTAGARMVMSRPGGRRDPRYLVRLIGRERVTALDVVPSMLWELLKEPELAECSCLHRMFVGAEALPVELARRFHERLGVPGGVELYNMYGPTETAVDAVSHRCEPGEQRIPIGRPIAGVRSHVLDAGGGLVPIGVAGELCLGGAQVARGYLHRPASTAERFVPDPHGTEPGARLYRTGDLARHLPDGEVELLGRIDRQAKVRGLRIEVDEIESVLCEHPAVRAGAGARSPTEEIVAGIWAEVLEIDAVSSDKSFFELGGHSLLATRAAARIRRALGVDLPLRVLFEATTVRALAAILDGHLRPVPSEPIPVLPRPFPPGEPPLSPAQERLWFLGQLDRSSPAYNIPAGLRLRGRLDTGALRGALTAVVARHESLRTTFGETERGAYQVIAPPAPVPMPCVDLSGIAGRASAAAEAEALRLGLREAARPFDLARGPLFRLALVRFSPDDHLLVFGLHHTIADGWSVDLMIHEVGERYGALREGRQGVPPQLPIQYPDFAVWQRGWLESDELASKLARARERLAGAPLHQDLASDRPRPPVQSMAGDSVHATLDPALTAGVRGLGRRSGATTFMVLLSGFAALLARHGAEADLLIGTPVGNRDRVEIEKLIGLFVNTLVVRCNLSGNPSVAEMVRRVRDASLEGYAGQDVPFERLVAELSRERNLGQNPVVQAMFSLLEMAEPLRLPGLEVESFDLPNGTAKLDLTLTALDRVDDLVLSLNFSTDLFDATTARRWLERYRILLAGIVEGPEERRLADLPLLTAPERAQLLREWSDTGRPVPETTVDGLFRSRAERAPEAPAALCDGRGLSYGELARKARGLAHRLRALGVGRGDLVGIALERSLEMLVAVLAVLEAGGAYVPLDPSYPGERLAVMLEDADPRVLITTTEHAPDLPPHGARRVAIDDPEERERIAAGADELLAPVTGPDDLAYVLFTSGSTGRPKGVEVPHGAVVNLLTSMAERPGLTADDRLLAVSSLSFDIAGLELFLPLAVGARVEIATREVTRNGLRLLDRVTGGGITALQATPATWKLLLEAGWTGGEDLRVLCGGEAMPPALAAALAERSSRVWNLYGPTEATIYSTRHPVISGSVGAVPIGRPIANTAIRLLGPRLETVPVGVVGELYIGGAGLARGYRGRPGMTAERFVPDPHGTEPGARLYRTGDLARVLPSGVLDFLGRADHQVKLRGHRIELGEIEAALGTHPEVAACAAALRTGPDGELRIVAYSVPRAGESPRPDALRSHLRERLPEPMVPASFVSLSVLPLTPNGKIDRNALPEPEAGSGSRPSGAAPRTETERRVADVWHEVLGVEPGLHDNFFDLGGHSLLLLRAHRKLQTAFGQEVPLTEMFRHPTVASLSELLADGGGDERSLDASFARAARKRAARKRPRTARRGER